MSLTSEFGSPQAILLRAAKNVSGTKYLQLKQSTLGGSGSFRS